MMWTLLLGSKLLTILAISSLVKEMEDKNLSITSKMWRSQLVWIIYDCTLFLKFVLNLCWRKTEGMQGIFFFLLFFLTVEMGFKFCKHTTYFSDRQLKHSSNFGSTGILETNNIILTGFNLFSISIYLIIDSGWVSSTARFSYEIWLEIDSIG